MLSNEKFVNKAPQAKVEEERKKLENTHRCLPRYRREWQD